MSGSILFGMLILFFACVDHHDVYKGEDESGKLTFNEFDFVTTQEVNLQVNYQNMGGIQTAVYFEVYDEMPVTETEYNYVKKEGVEPLFGYLTEKDGTFSKTLTLPSYAKTLYIYTPAFYARSLIEVKVENGMAVASDVVPEAKSAGTKAGGNYTSKVIDEEGWKTWLGTFNRGTGEVNYKYKGEELRYTYVDELYSLHASVVNVNASCPDRLRISEDFCVNEAGEVAVTFLGGNTCWNSSLGYYYYPEGQKPASLEEANVIMIFPNTQDGCWSNNWWAAQAKKGVDRGTVVQLKYYPEIANNSKTGETTVFPAHYRIGFVLATNAWTNRIPGYTAWNAYRATTSEGLSVSKKGDQVFHIDKNGQPGDTRRSAVYRYTNKGTDAIIFSFEDSEYDDNFSDVVFTVKTNPKDMISDIPVIEDNKQTVKSKVGIYTFEDMWPARGDYDMNDVMVSVDYEKVMDASLANKGIYSETFTFITYENVAINKNGLGVTLENAGDADISLTIDGVETDWVKREGNVILLTDNVKNYMGKEYKLTLTYASAVKKEQARVKTFIWKAGEGEGNWEVHISKESPTIFADLSERYFGQRDDRSVLADGIFYVREGNYPFAIFLSGCTKDNISKLLMPENEERPIDAVYPDYAGWVTSAGKTNAGWYK